MSVRTGRDDVKKGNVHLTDRRFELLHGTGAAHLPPLLDRPRIVQPGDAHGEGPGTVVAEDRAVHGLPHQQRVDSHARRRPDRQSLGVCRIRPLGAVEQIAAPCRDQLEDVGAILRVDRVRPPHVVVEADRRRRHPDQRHTREISTRRHDVGLEEEIQVKPGEVRIA